jgi:hypothetical protein
MASVLIHKGTYRANVITGAVFELAVASDGLKESGKGGFFINVKTEGTELFEPTRPTCRIRVMKETDCDFLGGDATEVVAGVALSKREPMIEKTDDQIMADTREKFGILQVMTEAALSGLVRGLVVSGPPGVGKSFGVEKLINQANDEIGYSRHDDDGNKTDNRVRYSVIKGSMTAAALYLTLYAHSEAGSVLVFDDADSILYDQKSLNLLKAVMDTGKTRRLSWSAMSGPVADSGVPDTFEFCGAVMFITNLDFDNVRGSTGTHLEAIMSRCHYLDMALNTTREKLLRCKQIVLDGMLDEYGFGADGDAEVIAYIEKNVASLKELSLRTVRKVADLRKMSPANWKTIANHTVLSNKV